MYNPSWALLCRWAPSSLSSQFFRTILSSFVFQTAVASYIRLFEPLVIHALKQYTITSCLSLQQQVLNLLAQLVQLRVNYCLLDSDQVSLWKHDIPSKHLFLACKNPSEVPSVWRCFRCSLVLWSSSLNSSKKGKSGWLGSYDSSCTYGHLLFTVPLQKLWNLDPCYFQLSCAPLLWAISLQEHYRYAQSHSAMWWYHGQRTGPQAALWVHLPLSHLSYSICWKFFTNFYLQLCLLFSALFMICLLSEGPLTSLTWGEILKHNEKLSFQCFCAWFVTIRWMHQLTLSIYLSFCEFVFTPTGFKISTSP